MSATHHQLTTGTELTSSKRQKHINRAYFLLVIFAALLMMLGSVDKGNNGLVAGDICGTTYDARQRGQGK